MTLYPNQTVPEFQVNLVGGEPWRLSRAGPELFAMLVFYRGLHCPKCRDSLRRLDGLHEDFQGAGVEAVAVSSDTAERAAEARREWGLRRLPVGSGVSVETGRRWGLFVSRGLESNEREPELFLEPGLFLVRPDGRLYASYVQSVPFARPDFGDLLEAVRFIRDEDYPARGEVLPRAA